MTSKNTPPIGLLKGKRDVSPVIVFYYEVAEVKQLYRQGWLDHGIPPEQCESHADHCLMVGLLAFTIATEEHPELDAMKCFVMGALHDLPEIITGDPTPKMKVPDNVRRQREEAACATLFSHLPKKSMYEKMWMEFADQKTPEARFVKDVDRLEMALQASIYEKQHHKDLSAFYTYVKERVKDPHVKKILRDIMGMR